MRHDTPHYNLIAAALTGKPWDPGPGWDWDKTVATAAREEVLPAMHTRLPCPPEIADFFEAIHQLNAERNRQLLDELETTALLLNKVGIEPMLLKGAAYLVAGVYSDPADRLLRDIDLLVSPSQSAEVSEIIRQAGYEPYVPNPTALVLHHHPTLTQLHRFPVEIHHSLGDSAASAILPADDMLKRSTPLRLGRAIVRLPSAEHLMTHLIVHSQMQNGPYDRIWPSLRSMLDLVVLTQRFMPSWDAVCDRYRLHRKIAVLNLHWMQIAKTLGVPPPFPIPSGGIRWLYRRALWREPRLRHIDLFFTFSRMVLPKIRLSWRLLRHPVGRKYVLLTPFRPSFYKHLLSDLVRG